MSDKISRAKFLRISALGAAGVFLGSKLEARPYSLMPAGDAAPDDWAVVVDTTSAQVRHVEATTSEKVCSKRINLDIDLASRTIKKARFVGGCPGNTLGVCKLVEGMKVDEVIATLGGINCSKRGTSCPDQLTRVLKSLDI